MRDRVERILVMRYRFIGDTLLTVPFLRNLRRAKPDAVIDMLVAPNSGEVLTHCPYIDHLMVLDTTRKHRYEQKPGEAPKGFWHYVSLLKANGYDTAYVLKRSWSSALLATFAGIPKRVGFDTEGRGLLLTQRVPYQKAAHEVDCFLDVLKADGIDLTDRYLEAWWSQADTAKVDQLWQSVSGRQQHCLIHATASNPAKQWPTAFWQQLILNLLALGYTLHAVGACGDLKNYEPLLAGLTPSQREHVHLWCGQTSLTESLALLAKMDLAIGVDSGTLHMAAAAGIPLVALMPQSNVTKWAPLGENSCIVTTPSVEAALEAFERACLSLRHPQPTP